jgi:hypothetical protein
MNNLPGKRSWSEPRPFWVMQYLLFVLLLSGSGFAAPQAGTPASGKKNAQTKSHPGKKQRAQKNPSRKVAPAQAPIRSRENEADDPDLPAMLRGKMDKETYLKLRAQYIARIRGIDPKNPPDPRIRMDAIRQMEQQEQQIYGTQRGTSKPAAAGTISPLSPPSSTTWTPVGPAPIPNGQTSPVEVPVSGRVTAIAVDPRNSDVVYVGAAQGGVYRSLDGGNTWTPLMDSAQSLAIGAITIDPLNPSTVFVGTGEGNNSLDSFFGVGLYRIDNADTNPVLSGPFETRINGTGTNGTSGNHAFIGTSITKIVVDPNNDNRIFVGNTVGFDGVGGNTICCGNIFPFASAFVGLYFSANALSSNPQFSRVAGVPGSGAGAVTDIAFEPGSSDHMLVAVNDFFTGNQNTGIYRTTIASQASAGASPTFSETLNLAGKLVNTKLAINNVNQTITALAGTSENRGTLYKSTDGGASWPVTIGAAAGFCDGQCPYDLVVTLKPDDANTFFLGGAAGSTTLKMTTDGGNSFTIPTATLHADTHAIVYAPTNYNVMYEGNDGGIWRSDDGGNTWSSRNTAGFSVTQFQSLALHPLDRNFMIGGTQDNGTPMMRADGSWFRTDFGDGGYSLIDQNATDTTNVTMYHTYFNISNALVGYAYVTGTSNATEGNWNFSGCSDGVTPGNGITCSDRVLFYAPMALGPGNPNTIYYGTDRLYRSDDGGKTNTVVSQAPLAIDPTTGLGVPISTIDISSQNDNVRIVGLANGKVFATNDGSSFLTDVSGSYSGALPQAYISRVAIDPVNPNIAYVTFAAYLGGSYNIMTTTNLYSGSNTYWFPLGAPEVPVDSFVIDPFDANSRYAGTDIGVYHSADSGFSWTPYGIGLPRVAAFDLAIQNRQRVLRVATHGRGVWEIGIPLRITHFYVNFFSNGMVPAGSVILATVDPEDASGNSVRYGGKAHFTSSDPKAILPADCTPPCDSYGYVPFTFGTPGVQTVTATDTIFNTITGTSNQITVVPGPTDHFNIVPTPSGIVAGNPISVTVTAQDVFNNTTPAYTGTAHFTSSDPQAVLPTDSTLNNGIGTFPVTLKTARPQTITATDTVTSSIQGTSSPVTVSAAAARNFSWSVPFTASISFPFAATLTAFDSFNNIATSYTGSVQLSTANTSGTPAVSVLATNPYPFTSGIGNFDNGVHTFASGFNVTAGNRGDTFTITGNDAGNGITATSQTILVTDDKPLTGTGHNISMFRSNVPVVVASFTDADTDENGTNLLASINWGDGTTDSGNIVRVGTTNVFNVMGAHNYAKKKIYTVTVTMTDSNGIAGNGSIGVATSTVRFFPINASH